MKVILVNGSPHKNGCTHRALEEIACELQKLSIESEIFWIGTKVQSCIGCYSCMKSGKCTFSDVVAEFLEKARSANGFVFGSPVYYANIAGGLASFMDRTFFSGGSILANKVAAGVVSCRRAGASAAFSRLNMYFTINNMPVVPSQYWNEVHGSVPSDVEKDLEGLQTMRTLAQNMAWLMRSLESGSKNGACIPQYEASVKTNFIRQ